MDPTLFGARIRQAREQLGMSQGELAHRMARDQRAISEYENGKRRLAAVDLPTLAEALDVPLMFFFEDAPNPHDLDNLILDEFHRFPTGEAKQVLIKIARVLAEAFDESQLDSN